MGGCVCNSCRRLLPGRQPLRSSCSGIETRHTTECEVRHPSWNLWRATTSRPDLEAGAVYGDVFVGARSVAPTSAFVVDGSPITVHAGRRFDA